MVMNYWIASYTSANIVKVFKSFFDWCSRRDPWKEKESIVICTIWINDCSVNKKTKLSRVSKEEFEKNLNVILENVKNDDLIKKLIFVLNINVDEDVINSDDWDFFFFNSEIIKYNNIIKNFCKKNNLAYIDLFWIMEKDDLEDWLHPNNKWHQKIFEKVREFLEK